MLKKLFYCLFTISLALSPENINGIEKEAICSFSVSFSDNYFYCGEDLVITIKSNNEIHDAGIIKIELYWQKNIENENLIKIYEEVYEIKQKSIVINFPTEFYIWDENLDDILFIDEISEEYFEVKIYFNNVLISENNEILIWCSTGQE